MTTLAPRPAPPADTAVDPSADDGCYRALQARDARFDGRFFTGVTSTGIEDDNGDKAFDAEELPTAPTLGVPGLQVVTL